MTGQWRPRSHGRPPAHGGTPIIGAGVCSPAPEAPESATEVAPDDGSMVPPVALPSLRQPWNGVVAGRPIHPISVHGQVLGAHPELVALSPAPDGAQQREAGEPALGGGPRQDAQALDQPEGCEVERAGGGFRALAACGGRGPPLNGTGGGRRALR